MGGLREGDGGDQGGLREDVSSSGGLRADGQASEPARAKAPSAATFGFVAPQLQEAEAAMRAGAPMTARLLDLDLKELLAGRVDASAVHASVRALIKKKQELEGRGQNFAHLKSLPKAYPEFAKRLEQIAAGARKEAAACSEHVRSMALAEVRRKLTDRAREYYENDVHEGKDKKIDRGEYELLVKEARGFLFAEAIASEVLLACRAVVGDPSWQPPVDDRVEVRRAAAEREWREAQARADEQRGRAEEQRRLRIEAERAQSEEQRRMEEAALLRDQEQRRKAEEEARKAEEERRAREAEASAAREHAAAVKAAADAASAEVEQERLRAERDRELFIRTNEAGQHQVRAIVTVAVAALAGALVGLGVARIGGVAGTGSATSVAVSRQAVLATTSSERLRRVCGVGKDTEAVRGRLRAELDVAVKLVPSPEDRGRLAEKGGLACAAPHTRTSPAEQGR